MDLKISVLTVTLFFVKQYLALRAVAKKAYTSLRIHVLYDCNANVVYYDRMQLFKEEFGHSYVYDANGNITSVTDLQKKNTTYEYANNNLTKITLPSGASQTYTYDSYHNVLTATSSEGVVSGFTYDTYGNNTKVTVSGSGQTQTISATAAYTADGNQLASVTDALGKTTTYNYDPQTGVLNWVQEPDQTDSNRTNYTYDSRLRTTGVSQENAQVGYTYSTNALLTSITSASGTAYNFAYGAFDQLSSVRIGRRTLVRHTYSSDGNRTLTRSTYGNGDSVSYTYDALGRATSKAYENGDTVGYRYDNSSNLGIMTDSATGRSTQYFYDFQNRLMRYEESGQGHSNTVQWGYDDENNLSTQTQTLNGNTYTTQYTYDRDNRLTKTTAGNVSASYTYDALGRMTGITVKNGNVVVVNTGISYTSPSSTATSTQVAAWNNGIDNYTYQYNRAGNISSYFDNGDEYIYTYDDFGRLQSVEDFEAGDLHTYRYDSGGNLTTRRYIDYYHSHEGYQTLGSYTYGDSQWKDLLTAYNGNPITYDAIGNPLTDGTWTYTWQHGRQLVGMEKDGTSISYAYNADGKRISKTVDGITYNYHYLGDQLVEMTWGSNRMRFSYDAIGAMSVNYNGTDYFYLRNAQGDVTGLVDSTGAKVVTYAYDPWGKTWAASGTLASTLGTFNPLRYRGYVYDTETGLYYLNSRYYNPTWGRFINADNAISGSGESVNGYNLFAYCFNNPVNMEDQTGNWPKWLEKVAKAVAVAAVVVTAVVVVAVATAGTGGAALAAAGIAFGTSCGGLVGGIANEKKKESFINGWAGGAANGLFQSGGTALFGPTGTIVGGGVGSGIGTAITERLNNKGKPKQQQKSTKEIVNESLKSAAIGTVMSFMTAGIGYGIDYAQSPSGYNAWAGTLRQDVGIAPMTPAFGEMMKGFLGSADDALVYIFCE